MKSRNPIQSAIVIIALVISTRVYSQSPVGLNVYANMRQTKETAKMSFALSKPLHYESNYQAVATTSMVLVPVSSPKLTGYYMGRLSRRDGPDKHDVGVGLLIGGGVCIIAGALLLNAAKHNTEDDWGFSLIAETIGGYVVGGCGIGMSATGLALVLKYRGGHNRY